MMYPVSSKMRFMAMMLVLSAVSRAEDYVESLNCGREGLTLVLKKNSSMARALFAAEPPVPTLLIKQVWPTDQDCSHLIAGTHESERTLFFNYTSCNATMATLDNGHIQAKLMLVARPILPAFKVEPYTFGVSCMYFSHAEADSGSDQKFQHRPGGGSGSVHTNESADSGYFLAAEWTDPDGVPVWGRTVYFDDPVSLSFQYVQGLYKSMLPQDCYLAESLAGNQRVSFFSGGCPVRPKNFFKYEFGPRWFNITTPAMEFTTHEMWAHCSFQLCPTENDSNCQVQESCYDNVKGGQKKRGTEGGREETLKVARGTQPQHTATAMLRVLPRPN